MREILFRGKRIAVVKWYKLERLAERIGGKANVETEEIRKPRLNGGA